MNRFEVFGRGVEILTPGLRPHGFEFNGEFAHQYPSIVGRGEETVRGEFARGDRRLQLELSYSLRNVVYRIGDLWLAHDRYMRALAVPVGTQSYPGFSNDPLDGFRHLRADLEYFGEEFLRGHAVLFRQAAEEEAARRPAQQRKHLAWMAGDDSARWKARELFHARRFSEVVALLDALKYPEFMDMYERKILEISRRRSGSR
jgi:hypothetical protein